MTKRLFVAIPFKPDDRLVKDLYSMKTSSKGKINWVEVKNMHLTLKFLGDVAIDRIPIITKGLSNISRVFGKFDLETTGFNLFYKGKHPSVLYLNIKEDEILKSMAKEIATFFEGIKIGELNNSFRAHITVARIKYWQMNDIISRSINSEVDQRFMVDRFELIESRLTTSGPIYDVVERFMLPCE